MHHHKEGTGFLQPQRQSYKLTKDGRYGDLTIDITQLFGFNRLIAIKKIRKLLLIKWLMMTL